MSCEKILNEYLPFFDKKKEIVRGVDRKIPEINMDILALTEKA